MGSFRGRGPFGKAPARPGLIVAKHSDPSTAGAQPEAEDEAMQPAESAETQSDEDEAAVDANGRWLHHVLCFITGTAQHACMQ